MQVEEGEDAYVFTTMKHVEFFQNTFKFYLGDETPLDHWAVVHNGDNHPINRAICRELGIFHTPCYSHTLNLDMTDALTHSDADHPKGENPNNLWLPYINDAEQTMLDCKRQMKNRSILRTQTHLSPKLRIKQRWSGTFHMTERYNLIYDISYFSCCM